MIDAVCPKFSDKFIDYKSSYNYFNRGKSFDSAHCMYQRFLTILRRETYVKMSHFDSFWWVMSHWMTNDAKVKSRSHKVFMKENFIRNHSLQAKLWAAIARGVILTHESLSHWVIDDSDMTKDVQRYHANFVLQRSKQ